MKSCVCASLIKSKEMKFCVCVSLIKSKEMKFCVCVSLIVSDVSVPSHATFSATHSCQDKVLLQFKQNFSFERNAYSNGVMLESLMGEYEEKKSYSITLLQEPCLRTITQ